ncbi:MAG: hypothetical protein EU539_13040 [Promethearchaeota archaeon]|nr:MAG: hypothetical protein EU539_13040 [Candidatus Lokiarchaeota archaeon]
MARKKKKEAAKELASALKKKKAEIEAKKDQKVTPVSAKHTEEALQSLLHGISEGKGFYKREVNKEDKIEPRLTIESKSKIAEDYMMEDIPISERPSIKKREPIKLPEELKEEAKEAEPEEEITKANIYAKLAEFFEEFMKAYNERYNQWENSVGNILAILRKMRKVTKKNTEELVESFNNLFDKIQDNLQQFKVKRDEIEKIAGVDILTMSGEFKKVLGLLELQIKEYQLKRLTDECLQLQNLYPNL